MEVVVVDSSVHKQLWRVAEANPGDDTISTIRMLSGLFQIKDCHHVLLLELIKNIELPNQAIAESLRANNQVLNPL